MDKLGLEYARKRKNLSRPDMAKAIGKSPDTYAKKENGEVKFTLDEIPIIARVLELTSDQVNAIFFDGNLPKR